jgi:peptide/nickel transport system substrate-binding protein
VGTDLAQADRPENRAHPVVDDAAQPMMLRGAAVNCWQPHVRGFAPHDNSQHNNLRFEDVWLDK